MERETKCKYIDKYVLHSRIQAAEMRYLQRVQQKTRRDKVCSQTIRMALNAKPLQSQIQQMQLR
jgi:hypothetical protein